MLAWVFDFSFIRCHNNDQQPMINCSICQLNGALLCRWICIFNRVTALHCPFLRAVGTYYITTTSYIPIISSTTTWLPSTHSFIRLLVEFTCFSIHDSFNQVQQQEQSSARDKPANKEWGNDPSVYFSAASSSIGMIYLLSHWILNKPSGHATKWSSLKCLIRGNPPFPLSTLRH